MNKFEGQSKMSIIRIDQNKEEKQVYMETWKL